MLDRRLGQSIAAFRHSFFLWGPRRVGKGSLLRQLFPDAPRYDLRDAAEFQRLSARPTAFAEECAALAAAGEGAGDAARQPVVVEGVQRLPGLVEEVRKLIAQKGLRFVLAGEDRRGPSYGGGLFADGEAGRSLGRELLPLTSAEIPDFSLARALDQGLLPPHYLADSPEAARESLRTYVGEYLREEILAGARVRNLPAFQRFLEMAARSSGQIVNYAVIGRECGVSAKTVATYFDILVGTFAGAWVPAWTRRARRRVIGAPRFYLFDVGVAGELLRRGPLAAGSPGHGAAFGHFIFMELRAHAVYSRREGGLSWWKTAGGRGIDFVLGDGEAAVDVAAAETATSDRLKGLRSYREEFRPRRSILVCLAPRPVRTDDGVEVMPWRDFLGQLWAGDIW